VGDRPDFGIETLFLAKGYLVLVGLLEFGHGVAHASRSL
jgi:hypothetical protein